MGKVIASRVKKKRPADPKAAAAPADVKRRIAHNPTARYLPSGNGWWGWASSSLDGAPVFTWYDIPRMLRDPKVVFIEGLWRAPFQKVQFVVKASSEAVGNFVQNTIKRFWRGSLPKLLGRYFEYGFAPGGAEYCVHRGMLRLKRVKPVECRDAQPRVWLTGEHRGQFAGFNLRAGGDAPETFVGPPHAMWFCGHGRISPWFDRPPIQGLFEPWLEKNGRGGALHMRRTWFRKNAARGMIGYYPPGVSNVGPADQPSLRDNQDIMREILDYGETNATYVFENTINPGSSEPEWKLVDAEAHGDVAGFLDYPKDLDKAMVEGAGIPLEVIQGSDSGSGYKGRLVSYGGFLGTVDELTGLILEACEGWLTPCVHVNFGEEAWYEIEPISLSQIAQEEEKRQPTNPVGQPLASLPGAGNTGPNGGGGDGGNLPFQLSARDDDDDEPEAGGDEGERLGPPAVKRFSLDDVTDDRPRALDLSVTLGPDADNPQVKLAAFKATQSRLMRSRKSTIAQLLALAMVRKQQEATAQGDPDAAAGSLEALSNLASDPIEVARIVGMAPKGAGGDQEMSAADWDELELAWQPFTSRRGGVGAFDPETGRKVYGEQARKLLAGHDRAKTKQEKAARAKEAVDKIVGKGEVHADDLKALAGTVAHLSHRELDVARKALEHKLNAGVAFNMKGKRLKADRVELLLKHVEAKVGAVRAAPKPKPEPAAAPHAAVSHLTDAIKNSPGLSEEQKKRYGEAVESVTGHMPKAALDRIGAHLKRTVFHPSTRDIGPALAADAVAHLRENRATGEDIAEWKRKNADIVNGKLNIGGGYFNRGRALHVDGDHAFKGNDNARHGVGTGGMRTSGVYAHELGHAIDGPKHEISNSPEWQKAHDEEIVSKDVVNHPQGGQEAVHRLSKYAATKPSEGLAEFSRLVYGSDVPHAQIAKEFPQATAVFKARGLWPGKERGGGESKMPEAFDKRVELAPDGSHADILKPPVPSPAPAPEKPPAPPAPPTPQVSGNNFDSGKAADAKTDDLLKRAPWELSPAELRVSGVTFFRTSKGSLYALHPKTGATIRVKSDHTAEGHEKGDTGLKTPSTKTVYVDPKRVAALSAAGLQGAEKPRVVLKDGRATLVTFNPRTGQWGAAPSARDVAVHDKPAKGLAPLELWQGRSDVPGHEAYAGMHAGNEIAADVSPEDAHAEFVKAAKAAGKKVYEAPAPAPPAAEKPPAPVEKAIAKEVARPAPAPVKTGADRVAALKAKRAGKADAAPVPKAVKAPPPPPKPPAPPAAPEEEPEPDEPAPKAVPVEHARLKSRVAYDGLAAAVKDNASHERLFQLAERVHAASRDLPEAEQARLRDAVRAALLHSKKFTASESTGGGRTSAQEAADRIFNAADAEPEVEQPKSVKDILADEAAVLAKRRAKAAPKPVEPAPAPAPATAPKPPAPEPAAGTPPASKATLAADAERVEDEARTQTGWARSGADRIRALRAELDKPPERASSLDLNGIAEALRNYATSGEQVGRPVGGMVDRLARELVARMTPAQKDQLVAAYAAMNRHNSDTAPLIAELTGKRPEPAEPPPAPAKPKPKKRPEPEGADVAPKAVAAVRRQAAAEKDPVARDYLESALHNHDGTPADLAAQLGTLLEETGFGPGAGPDAGPELRARKPPPPAAAAAVRRALAALGAAEAGPKAGAEVEWNGRSYQPLAGVRGRDRVRVVTPPLALPDGRVVSKGKVEPLKPGKKGGARP